MNKFQNINKHRTVELFKLIGKLVIFWIFIYIILIYFYSDMDKISSLTKDVFLQSFSTLMGVVIASVGILIGTISGLYTILISVNINKKISKDISEDLDFKLEFNIPYYIELYPLLSKVLILTSLSILLIILGIWITYDIVMTIFTIYQAYILVTKNSLLNKDPSTK